MVPPNGSVGMRRRGLGRVPRPPGRSSENPGKKVAPQQTSEAEDPCRH